MNDWRTSSYSYSNGACVEVASWRKARHSLTAGHCVEAASGRGAVLVRDSQLKGNGPALEFPPGAWRAFTRSLAA